MGLLLRLRVERMNKKKQIQAIQDFVEGSTNFTQLRRATDSLIWRRK